MHRIVSFNLEKFAIIKYCEILYFSVKRFKRHNSLILINYIVYLVKRCLKISNFKFEYDNSKFQCRERENILNLNILNKLLLIKYYCQYH